MNNSHIIVNDVKLYSFQDVIAKNYKRKPFEPKSFKIWESVFTDVNDATIVDVGSYTGIYSLYASINGATSIAFEPSPVNFGRLLENVKLNSVNDKVIAVNMAVSNINSRGYLSQKASTPLTTGGKLSREKEQNDAVEVPMISLDEYFNLHPVEKVDAMKIDVEGHELEVLLGGKNFLSTYLPKVLLIECFSDDTLEKVGDILTPLGYERGSFLDERNWLFTR